MNHQEKHRKSYIRIDEIFLGGSFIRQFCFLSPFVRVEF